MKQLLNYINEALIKKDTKLDISEYLIFIPWNNDYTRFNNSEYRDKLEKSIQRLQSLNNKYNAAEGIVIMYKGRRMKFIDSFAPLNAALGIRFTLEEK